MYLIKFIIILGAFEVQSQRKTKLITFFKLMFFIIIFFACASGRPSVSPLAQCADVGSSITFTCNAKAVPSQNFTWLRQERIETVNNGGRFSIVSTLGSSQLIVKNVSIADRGYYSCDATMNSVQQNKAVFYFQVPCSGKSCC